MYIVKIPFIGFIGFIKTNSKQTKTMTHKGTENLIPMSELSEERAREIRSMGGKTVTEKKRIANTLNPMKTGKYSKKFNERIIELAKNPEKSAFEIFNLITALGSKFEQLSDAHKIQLGNLFCKAHQTVHGSKSLNVNVNDSSIGALKDYLEGKVIDVTPEVKDESK